jgi:O-Antigen ligase
VTPPASVTTEAHGGLPVPAGHATRVGLLILGAAAVLAGTAAGGTTAEVGALLAIALAIVAMLGSRLLGWGVLAGLILAVALFVPARRVVLAVHVPIDPEPYRVLAAGVFLLWLVALLIDPQVRLRKTAFDWPLAILLVAILLSQLANPGLVDLYGQNVVKALTLFVSILLLYYFVTSVFTTRGDVAGLVKALVVGGTVVAAAALVERTVDYNVFDQFGRLPGLQVGEAAPITERLGSLRVMASAEHPIALGALLALVVPFSLYLVRHSRWWLLTTAALASGVVVTVSRTPIVMLVASAIVFAVLRPRVLRFAPLVPLVLVIAYLATPGALSSTFHAFFPSGGILAEQSTSLNQGGSNTRGRLSDLRPALRNVSQRPLFGSGLGTRVYDPDNTAGYLPDGRYGGILDDQWLGSLVDIGVLGVAALMWLFLSGYRALAREARARNDDDGWLATAFATVIVSFPVGMLFFDTFSFTQVTVVFFFILGVAAVFVRAVPPVGTRPIELVPMPRRRRVVSQLHRVFDHYSVGRAPEVDER